MTIGSLKFFRKINIGRQNNFINLKIKNCKNNNSEKGAINSFKKYIPVKVILGHLN